VSKFVSRLKPRRWALKKKALQFFETSELFTLRQWVTCRKALIFCYHYQISKVKILADRLISRIQSFIFYRVGRVA